MILTITLNPALDLGVEVADWVLGEVNRATKVEKSPGGKGINVSRVLKELGDATTAVTILGSDSVQEFKRLAKEAGFTIVYISIPGEVRTNIHIVDPKNGRVLKVNQPGVPVQKTHFDHFQLLYKQQLRSARTIVLGGSLPPGLPTNAYCELLALARQQDKAVLIDAEGECLLEALPEQPLVAKPNRAELSRTLGRELSSTEDTLDAARELQRRGAKAALITDGPHPAVAVFEEKAWIVHPPKIKKVVGTNGAGDTTSAALISGLTRGWSFEDSLRFALAAGAASCLTEETQLVRRSDIDLFVRKVTVERVR